MNYWWVNHKQTFKHEFGGRYIWCPKMRADGRINPYYEFARMVRPGDVIFSYAFGVIQGAGLVVSHCYTCPRPNEFGRVGEVWDKIGWRVDVAFEPIQNKIRPKSHLDVILVFLQERHAPLRSTGDGRQEVYLTQISRDFAEILVGLIGSEAVAWVQQSTHEAPLPLYEIELKGIEEWENVECQRIALSTIPETERYALLKARIGQGRFKESVFRYEKQCRVTHVRNPVHLIASHIKPWRESSNIERLSPGNGLMLTPTVDHLFDRGFISFDDSGETLISPVADPESLIKMGINPKEPPKVGIFNKDQQFFLNHHRKSIFLKSAQT